MTEVFEPKKKWKERNIVDKSNRCGNENEKP